jgi:hypothetical protein
MENGWHSTQNSIFQHLTYLPWPTKNFLQLLEIVDGDLSTDGTHILFQKEVCSGT